MHTCACFMHIYRCFYRICCLTSQHTSIHKGIHERGAARSAAPFMDGCVWAGEATDAMETSINMHETCTCMHITRNSCGYLANTYENIHWLNAFIYIFKWLYILLYTFIYPRMLLYTFIYLHIHQNIQY